MLSLLNTTANALAAWPQNLSVRTKVSSCLLPSPTEGTYCNVKRVRDLHRLQWIDFLVQEYGVDEQI